MFVVGVPFGFGVVFDFRAVKAMSVCEETEGIRGDELVVSDES